MIKAGWEQIQKSRDTPSAHFDSPMGALVSAAKALGTELLGIYVILCQFFPPRAIWSVEQIPDLTGKICLVTGSLVGTRERDIHHARRR